jgi:hypothetical protein
VWALVVVFRDALPYFIGQRGIDTEISGRCRDAHFEPLSGVKERCGRNCRCKRDADLALEDPLRGADIPHFIYPSEVAASAEGANDVGALAKSGRWTLTLPSLGERTWTDNYSNVAGTFWRKLHEDAPVQDPALNLVRAGAPGANFPLGVPMMAPDKAKSVRVRRAGHR